MTTFHPFFEQFIRLQNRLQNAIGKLVAWGTLSLVVITALVVILRYGFETGSIALQESIMYNHAILFMLGIAYTYLHDEHVRVDVFYSNFSARKQHWIDLLGSVFFTIPITVYIFWASADYIAASWAINEGSAEAGGLGYVYLLKTLIVIMASLLLLQALAVIAQSILKLQGAKLLDEAEHSAGGKL